MTRLFGYLALTAALSGPLLRHAEAAEDLARALAELRDPGSAEETDGGVGDEAELGLLRADEGRVGPAVNQGGSADGPISLAPLHFEPACSAFRLGPHVRFRSGRRAEPNARRQARLGSFLF
jgi:hypothetical protein